MFTMQRLKKGHNSATTSPTERKNRIPIIVKLVIIGPRQANLVLITYASSEGSGEPAHPRSLPEPLLLAHTSSESRGTFRQKIRSLAPLNGWACAVKICHDGMLEDTNSLDGAHLQFNFKILYTLTVLCLSKCNGRMDRQTDRPKPICPLNLFEFLGIKAKKTESKLTLHRMLWGTFY